MQYLPPNFNPMPIIWLAIIGFVVVVAAIVGVVGFFAYAGFKLVWG
jgi:hypothetical protein